MKWRLFRRHDEPPSKGPEQHDTQTQGKGPWVSENTEDRATEKGDATSDELITTENVSKELLKNIFDAAYMNTGHDDDGDLFVKDRCTCFVFCNAEEKKRRVVRLRTYFRFTAKASETQRLICANEINANYLILRAVVNDQLLFLEYDISLDGGLTKKALVLLLKRFCSIPHDAGRDYGKDIVE